MKVEDREKIHRRKDWDRLKNEKKEKKLRKERMTRKRRKRKKRYINID